MDVDCEESGADPNGVTCENWGFAVAAVSHCIDLLETNFLPCRLETLCAVAWRGRPGQAAADTAARLGHRADLCRSYRNHSVF